MKQQPIIFSGPMVRAILEGRKTQTRRVIKPQPVGYWADINGNWRASYEGPLFTLVNKDLRCPYGLVGGKLWVRETWAANAFLNNHKPSDLPLTTHIFYRASYHNPEHFVWRPSIFMPRWVSRLSLEIINTRVERLQKIDFSGIRAEGVKCPEHDFHSGFCASECATLRRTFTGGWDKLNAQRGFAWDINPFVWVIEFRAAEE